MTCGRDVAVFGYYEIHLNHMNLMIIWKFMDKIMVYYNKLKYVSWMSKGGFVLAVRLFFIAIRKVLVAFVSYFFLPYITIFVTKVFNQEVARNSLGEVVEHAASIIVLMSFIAVGSFVIEYIWGRREIQIPFAYIGVHSLYFAVVLYFYLQGWVYV